MTYEKNIKMKRIKQIQVLLVKDIRIKIVHLDLKFLLISLIYVNNIEIYRNIIFFKLRNLRDKERLSSNTTVCPFTLAYAN